MKHFWTDVTMKWPSLGQISYTITTSVNAYKGIDQSLQKWTNDLWNGQFLNHACSWLTVAIRYRQCTVRIVTAGLCLFNANWMYEHGYVSRTYFWCHSQHDGIPMCIIHLVNVRKIPAEFRNPSLFEDWDAESISGALVSYIPWSENWDMVSREKERDKSSKFLFWTLANQHMYSKHDSWLKSPLFVWVTSILIRIHSWRLRNKRSCQSPLSESFFISLIPCDKRRECVELWGHIEGKRAKWRLNLTHSGRHKKITITEPTVICIHDPQIDETFACYRNSFITLWRPALVHSAILANVKMCPHKRKSHRTVTWHVIIQWPLEKREFAIGRSLAPIW